MITVRLRIASGIAAAALLTAAWYVLVREERLIGAVLLAPAALLCIPLFASSRPPRIEELKTLDENAARFRAAGLICFTIAVLVHTAAAVLRLGAPLSQRFAAFGVAWWAVGFGMVPFAVYFASRRAMLEDDSAD